MIQRGGYIRDIMAKPVGTAVEAYGWVKTRRDSKGVHFLQLNDGSSFKDLQVVVEAPSTLELDADHHLVTSAVTNGEEKLPKEPVELPDTTRSLPAMPPIKLPALSTRNCRLTFGYGPLIVCTPPGGGGSVSWVAFPDSVARSLPALYVKTLPVP